MSIATSQAPTITVEEFEDTYSIASTEVDDNRYRALSYLIEYAKTQNNATYAECCNAMNSALTQPTVTEVQPEATEGRSDEAATRLAEEIAERAKAEFELAKAKAEAAYPYSELPLVLYIFLGRGKGTRDTTSADYSEDLQLMGKDLNKLNKHLASMDPEICLEQQDLVILAVACTQAGVAHSGQTSRELFMWKPKVFRAFCKLYEMTKGVVIGAEQ